MKKRDETPTSPNDDEPVKGPSPKWLEGDHHENAPKAKKHEYRLAKRLGGKRYRGSGNKKWSKWTGSSDTDKGDLSTPDFHLEHKFTRDASMSVKLEWLDKVREGCRKRLKDPGLIITFERGNPPIMDEWVMMPLSVFERLMRKVNGDE